MLKNIHTIVQLEKEMEKLQITMEVTRDALEESLGNNRRQIGRFLFENVVIPAGIFGLGTMAAKKFSSDSNGEQRNEKAKGKNFKINYQLIFKKLFPIALNMLEAFVLKKQSEKMQEYLSDEFDESDETFERPITPPLKSVS
jgi:hypothetical protein